MQSQISTYSQRTLTKQKADFAQEPEGLSRSSSRITMQNKRQPTRRIFSFSFLFFWLRGGVTKPTKEIKKP